MPKNTIFFCVVSALHPRMSTHKRTTTQNNYNQEQPYCHFHLFFCFFFFSIPEKKSEIQSKTPCCNLSLIPNPSLVVCVKAKKVQKECSRVPEKAISRFVQAVRRRKSIKSNRNLRLSSESRGNSKQTDTLSLIFPLLDFVLHLHSLCFPHFSLFFTCSSCRSTW
jgi:hypothetical protein